MSAKQISVSALAGAFLFAGVAIVMAQSGGGSGGSVYTATPPGSIMPSAPAANPSTGVTIVPPTGNTTSSGISTGGNAGTTLGGNSRGNTTFDTGAATGSTGRNIPGTGTPQIMTDEPGRREIGR